MATSPAPVSDPAINALEEPKGSLLDSKFAKSSPGKAGTIIFAIALLAGVIYIGRNLSVDLAVVHSPSVFPFILLGIALFIALAFEFVNGFHDTANAVATCIYTHSLEPHIAVVYSGIMNFIGVLLSSGTVAYSIVQLLPVELILKVSKGSGFAMVFALLVAAILWNLATWWRGLPASSSHTMVGSVIGVGIANQLMHGRSGVSGVDMDQVLKVGKALLVSPLVGFVMAALLFLLFKLVARDPRLYKAPEGTEPPPFYIRLLLIGTCGGVSYFHGSNDGQKGMGLIMLILVGTVPTAYALNHTVSNKDVQTFAAVSTQAINALRGLQLRVARRGSRGDAGQRPQPDVPHQRSHQPAAKNRSEDERGRYEGARQLPRVPRQIDQVHPNLGKGGSGSRSWPGHDDRLEAHRDHGRREDRQDAPDLRAGRLGGDHRDDHHLAGRHLRRSGQYDPRTELRHRRHHGLERQWSAAGDGKKYRPGVGLYPACRSPAFGRFVLALQQVGWRVEIFAAIWRGRPLCRPFSFAALSRRPRALYTHTCTHEP